MDRGGSGQLQWWHDTDIAKWRATEIVESALMKNRGRVEEEQEQEENEEEENEEEQEEDGWWKMMRSPLDSCDDEESRRHFNFSSVVLFFDLTLTYSSRQYSLIL